MGRHPIILFLRQNIVCKNFLYSFESLHRSFSPFLFHCCHRVMLDATFEEVSDIWQTGSLSSNVSKMPSLPVMQFLFCLPNILVSTFCASDAVDDVGGLAC